MADENEDQWLYGDSPSENTEESSEKTQTRIVNGEAENVIVPAQNAAKQVEDVEMAAGDADGGQASGEEGETKDQDSSEIKVVDGDEDEDSDDDVCVVIGDIKTTPTSYTGGSFNLRKSGSGYAAVGSVDKSKTPQIGSFAAAEFEGGGTINGVPAFEFNLDSLEDKPWRKPGADLTDYFNYGFTEDTWRAYCDRQRRLRVHESGTGLASLGMGGGAPSKVFSTSVQSTIPVAINDNSKYGAPPMVVGRKAGPPPGRKVGGSIDVIGASTPSRRYGEKEKDDPMQILPREFDTSVPPPNFESTTDFSHTYYPPPLPATYPEYSSYEPSQESQWVQRNQWDTPPPNSHMSLPMHMKESQDSRDSFSRNSLDGHDERERERDRGDRERDRDRVDRERDREDRDRHRSHRRRSRSRSPERRSRRSHRSRSRSPSHRHRRKKSKKERNDHSD